MPSFIHFGCWNKGGCNMNENRENYNPLTRVMYNLREISESRLPPEFVIVAGDNYYPEKGKSKGDTKGKPKKIIDSDKLMSGLECLPKNIPVHIILGNHDLESNVSVKDLDDDERNKCYILDKEIEYARSTQQQTSVNVYKSIVFNGNTLILMIDTTMYEDKETVALTCFRHLYRKDDLTLDDVRRDQKLWVEGVIKNIPPNIRNIIVVAHHPITGYKSKMKVDEEGNAFKDTFLIKSPGFNIVKLLYESIYKKLSIEMRNEIKFYYLCADLHQYQIGNIEISPQITSISSEEGYNPVMSIKQYVVGTGGTSLDDYPFEREKIDEGYYNDKTVKMLNPSRQHTRLENDYYDIKYSMTPEQINLSGSRYGFLKCNSDVGSDKLEFSFISSDGDILEETIDIIGGRKVKKTKQMKTRKPFKRSHRRIKKTMKKHKTSKRRKYIRK